MDPSTTDPSTGLPLHPDAIQRVLFLAPGVHVYQIPPLTSTKGYVAASWTENNNARQIFTARIRILETAVPSSRPGAADAETVTTAILLEDGGTGELFAAAPYTAPSCVEQALDSSRFFAARVQGGGRKAVLGIGFEERSEAFDFSVALQEVRKTLGMEGGGAQGGRGLPTGKKAESAAEKKDFSLKEGETITINIGGSKGRGRRSEKSSNESSAVGGFSLPPPPGGGLLPPPPSAQEVKAQKRLSQSLSAPVPGSIEDMGFDDGEFGEFQ